MTIKLNEYVKIDAFKEEIRKQAFDRDMHISDDQMEKLLSEAEAVFNTAVLMNTQLKVPSDRLVLNAFITGALFGKDGFRKMTCDVEMSIKDGRLEKATTSNTQEIK